MPEYKVSARIEVTLYIDAKDEDVAYFKSQELIKEMGLPYEMELDAYDILDIFQELNEN